MDARQIIISPVQSEKSYQGLEHNRYVFKVHPDATKTQIRNAIQTINGVTVTNVNTVTVKPKPKRRGVFQGVKPGYRKAIVTLKAGDSIQIFEGVH
jgi:large subunit ribosomal protein L23